VAVVIDTHILLWFGQRWQDARLVTADQAILGWAGPLDRRDPAT